MSQHDRMSPLELRASIGLASIFGLRLLGMFVILPVFAIYAERLPGGNDLTLVGIAIGAYGLTQAVLQIPFGWWSDRYGRKPVIYVGLAIFAAGSFVAAAAGDIYIVILGRVLQGAGAISAAVMAMAADLTRDEHRTKAMAMIGSTIGLSFALSLIASPWLNDRIGVPGLFALTGFLAMAAVLVVWRVVPDVVEIRAPRAGALREFWTILGDAQLARLNYGIFALHAVLMALFIVVPFALRDAGLPLSQHWKVYLPVMLASFVLMLPPIMAQGRGGHLKLYFSGSVALILAAHIALPWLDSGVLTLAFFLLLFFTPFNVLEALLPSLTSRLAPPGTKGVAIGLYSSIQFFGTFVGAAGGGYAYGRWGLTGVVIADVVLLVIWLVLSLKMRTPVVLSTRTYIVPRLDARSAETLTARLRSLSGVHDVRVVAGESTAFLTVDSGVFDEHNVLNAITEKAG
ncbi:MAG TPA: MFS transporter [Burkholderiales bacterium]|nr:MFS transporter [Burkholderiales bacterium]